MNNQRLSTHVLSHLHYSQVVDLESSLLDKNEQLEKVKEELSRIKQSCETGIYKMNEQIQNYKKMSGQEQELSQKLQDKEEEVDALDRVLHIRHKEIKSLKDTLERSLKERQKEVDFLKKELLMKKEELSECSSILNELQKSLEEKTEEYENLSCKVSQLESERDKTENELRIVRTECELKVQREAVRAQGAEDYAKEVEVRKLDYSQYTASMIACS